MCAAAQEGWLRLDAHIMATPAIGDLNGDGHEELVVGVSWFFDREYYEDPVGTFPLFYAPASHSPYESVCNVCVRPPRARSAHQHAFAVLRDRCGA